MLWNWKAPSGFKLDSTRHYFTVKDGEVTQEVIENEAVSGILLHKVDSATGDGIYGVTFLLYDDTNPPIGQYTSDDRGYVYIEGLESGRFYLRELENEGYIVDTEKKDRLCKVWGDHGDHLEEYPPSPVRFRSRKPRQTITV